MPTIWQLFVATLKSTVSSQQFKKDFDKFNFHVAVASESVFPEEAAEDRGACTALNPFKLKG